jgi:hypothetical protein
VNGLDSALSRQLGEEMSKVAADYWVTKVNSYRVRIDRMLSASDLAELNRFRVRAGIMMKDVHESGSRQATIRFSMSGNSAKAQKKGENVQVEVEGDVDGAKLDSKGMNGQDMQGAMGMIQSLMSNGNGEILEIYNGVKGIASHHRSDLDLLKEDVFNDVGAFIEMMAAHVNQFMAAHRDQIPQAKLDSMTMKIEEVHQKASSEELKAGMGMLYDMIGEPLLLLYDGSDISSLIPSSIAAPVPGVKMAENTTLRQSYPNPASSVATIRYMLQEPSSSTVLRLYDASGNTVATYDQGAQTAGEHSVDADVSKLASGTYLYHLTIQTGAGEQVFSKTLQVAR